MANLDNKLDKTSISLFSIAAVGAVAGVAAGGYYGEFASREVINMFEVTSDWAQYAIYLSAISVSGSIGGAAGLLAGSVAGMFIGRCSNPPEEPKEFRY